MGTRERFSEAEMAVFSEYLVIGKTVGGRIRDVRKRSGLEHKELGPYLAPVWECTPLSARGVIGRIERGAAIADLHLFKAEGRQRHQYTPADLQAREQLIADYCASLGISANELQIIFSGVERIQPAFSLPEPQVALYVRI